MANNIDCTHKMYKYITKKNLDKYLKWNEPTCVVQKKNPKKEATKICYIPDACNTYKKVENVTKKVEKVVKKNKKLSNPNGDCMNSVFEYEMSFIDDEADYKFIYEKKTSV